MDDGLFIFLVLGTMAFAVLVFVVKSVVVVFIAKKAYEAWQAQRQAVHRDVAALEGLAGRSGVQAQWLGLLHAAHQMQTVVDARARQQPRVAAGLAPAQAAQFRVAWSKAQMEMNHFDRLSRERADLHLADMKSQAASMGLFL